MPLFKTIHFSPTTQILVWKVTESFDELFEKVVLKEKTQVRLNGMKSQMHQRAFLCVRMLIQEVGINDYDLHYDEFGKPYLNDNRYISITHSHNFAAIIISEETVGIDMELQREKIIRIADKFVNQKELSRLQSFETQDYIKKLTVKWGAKEAIFKIRNEKGISFKDHIQVQPFSLTQNQTQAILIFDDLVKKFNIHYLEIENFSLVFAFEN